MVRIKTKRSTGKPGTDSNGSYNNRHKYYGKYRMHDTDTPAKLRGYCNQCPYLGTNACYGADHYTDCVILRNYTKK